MSELGLLFVDSGSCKMILMKQEGLWFAARSRQVTHTKGKEMAINVLVLLKD